MTTLSVLLPLGHAAGQEFAGRRSFGVTTTFAPNSSHILIGLAENRRTWTTGLEYTRTLWRSPTFQIDYEVSVSPFFQERDPTVVATSTTQGGVIVFTPVTPYRVVSKSASGQSSPGVIVTTSPMIYGTQENYAFSGSPIGARINGFNSSRIQSSFSTDLGFVVSNHELPIDNSTKFNYLFSFGPGIEFFYRPRASVRVEYLYRHMSNGGSGNLNPGVDQGVFRLTLSHHRN